MRRLRFVIDPLWKETDVERYSEAWTLLTDEATEHGFVGLDLEWTTRFDPEAAEFSDNGISEDVKKRNARSKSHVPLIGPVAVLQLGTTSVTFVIKMCDVFLLARGEPLPEGSMGTISINATTRSFMQTVLEDMGALLANASVAKVGVGVVGDRTRLQRDYPSLSVNACTELVALANYLNVFSSEERNPCGSRGLRGMALAFAETDLLKDWSVTRSDWGGRIGALSPRQVDYAAADAEASFDVCVGIIRAADLIDQRDAIQSALYAVSGIVPRVKARQKQQGCPSDKRQAEFCKGRSKPYYDNIYVYDADNQLVFTVDKSKAEWYVHKKGLAKVTEWQDDGVTMAAIQLNFKPDFDKFNDAHIRRNLDYFRLPKENHCVVCGASSALVRFAVVPLMYRKYFPSVYMSHNSYDLLLLCTKCFARARCLYDNERRRVATEFGVPLAHLTTREMATLKSQLEADISAPDSAGHASPLLTAETDAHPPVWPSPAQRMELLREYVEIEEHRDTLIRLLKCARALRGAASLPPERVKELSAFVQSHALRYPFHVSHSPNGAASNEDEKVWDAILSEEPRVVLARYWLQRRPEWREVLTDTTRRPDAEGDEGVPFVDSHGFLIVKALLGRYDENSGKGRDHAMGDFIYRWRALFVREMRPKHLPSGWRPEDGIIR